MNAPDAVAHLIRDEVALSPGTRLGAYEIISTIGAGGMGQVYRARDTRLGRDVAVKTLPDAFAADADRAARFQREVETLAALNHPNIGGVHGLEVSEGVTALVMEYPGGRILAFQQTRPQTSADLMTLTLEGDERTGWKPGAVRAFLSTPATEREPMFSPDGKWLAYQANDTGRFEVYVRPFPGPGGTWMISTDGGITPTWSRTRAGSRSPPTRCQPSRNAINSCSYSTSSTNSDA